MTSISQFVMELDLVFQKRQTLNGWKTIFLLIFFLVTFFFILISRIISKSLAGWLQYTSYKYKKFMKDKMSIKMLLSSLIKAYVSL